MSESKTPDFGRDDWMGPAGTSDDYRSGYTAGYDQAQFDLAQASDPRTLRDELAIEYARPFLIERGKPEGWEVMVSKDAYTFADAMLTAREGKGP